MSGDHARIDDLSGAPSNARADARACGLSDMVRSGWCNSQAGELFSGFDVGPRDTVLDVGCGDGLAVMFSAQQGSHVSFCDSDADKVRSLAARLHQRGLVRQAGCAALGNLLPFPDASMSRIVATEVLEHVDDPGELLRELVRVGKPGARYLISVPDAESERFQIPFAPESYFSAPNHVRIIEPRQLEELIEGVGLRVESSGQWGFYWFMWMNFYWATQQASGCTEPTIDQIRPPYHPLLQSWSETWTRFLELPEADAMQRSFNSLMPKSRVIVARRS